MARTKKTSVLGGHVYVVVPQGDRSLIHKIPNEGELPEDPYEIRDAVCSCKAGENSRECKHLLMAENTLSGPVFPRTKAERVLEDYLDRRRAEQPHAKLLSLMPYKKDREVALATALGCQVLSETGPARMTIWTEHEGLLIRIHCFKDADAYQKALHQVRQKTRSKESQETSA